MSNTNCKNLENCNYCYSCNYCYHCYSCNYCDSCYSCKGLRMSENMIFCLGEGKYETNGIGYQHNNMVFNVQVDKEEFIKIKNSLPTIKIELTKFIKSSDMSVDDKKEHSEWKTTGGYLKVFTYEEAWANYWDSTSKEDKDKILNCKHFDAEIFKGITGIDVKVPSLKGKTVKVELDGIQYSAIIQ